MQGGGLPPADRGRPAGGSRATSRTQTSRTPRGSCSSHERTATMTTSRRVGRWALIVVTVLVAAWVLLRVGVGVYLRTPAGRAVVAHQLQEVIGLPVEVSEVDLGSRSSSLKFRVLEPATGPSPPSEVLSVESATA